MARRLVTRESLEALLNSDKAMHVVGRALLVLMERQTEAERHSERTISHNGRGFTPADAKRGTSMAKFYRDRKYLSARQVAYWLRRGRSGVMRLAKYHAQLNEAAELKRKAMAYQAINAPKRYDRRQIEAEIEHLILKYNLVVDTDSIEIIKPVVDELRAKEKLVMAPPYRIIGSVYDG